MLLSVLWMRSILSKVCAIFFCEFVRRAHFLMQTKESFKCYSMSYRDPNLNSRVQIFIQEYPLFNFFIEFLENGLIEIGVRRWTLIWIVTILKNRWRCGELYLGVILDGKSLLENDIIIEYDSIFSTFWFIQNQIIIHSTGARRKEIVCINVWSKCKLPYQ